MSVAKLPLSQVATIVMGQSPPGSTYNRVGNGIALLNGPAEFGEQHPIPVQWTTAPNRFAEINDILFCVRGATTGRKCWSDQRYAIGRGLAAIRGREGICNTQFLWFLLDVVTEKLLQRAAGSTFANLPGEEILNFVVSLPPLPQQTQIAATLTTAMAAVDNARRAAEEGLAAAESLPNSYLRQVFEGPDACEWPRLRLGKLVTKIGSGITPRGGESAYVSEGVPLIRSQNVHMLQFEPRGLAFITPEQDKEMLVSRVQINDILINITGASIGRVCLVPDAICPANVNQHVTIIRAIRDRLSPLYLASYLASPIFQDFIWDNQAGATRQALTKEMIEAFEVPVPALAIQLEIATELPRRLQAAEALIARCREELAAIEALPAALLREAFDLER